MTSGDEVTAQRASTWTSGFRQCVASEGTWDNTEGDSVVGAAASNVGTTVTLDWTSGAPNESYYTATYKPVCVASGGYCEDTAIGTSTAVAEGVITDDITGVPTGATYTCYVQTLVSGQVRACASAGTLVM